MNDKEKELFGVYKGFIKETVDGIEKGASVFKNDKLRKMYYKDVAVALLQLIC